MNSTYLSSRQRESRLIPVLAREDFPEVVSYIEI